MQFWYIHRAFFLAGFLQFVSSPFKFYNIASSLCGGPFYRFFLKHFSFSLSLFFQEYGTCFATKQKEKNTTLKYTSQVVAQYWWFQSVSFFLVWLNNILLLLPFSKVGYTHVCFAVCHKHLIKSTWKTTIPLKYNSFLTLWWVQFVCKCS